MKKKTNISIIFFSILALSILSIPISLAADSYEIGIEEGDGIVWEYTYLDTSLIEDLVSYGFYDDDMEDISVGDQFRFDITGISEYYESNFGMYLYEVELTYYEGTNLETNLGEEIGDYYFHVGQTPELVGQYFYDDNSAFILDIIATPVEEYLVGFVSGIPSSYRDYFSINHDTTLIFDLSSEGYALQEYYEYNQQGILDSWKVLWQNKLILNYEYQGTYDTSSLTDLDSIILFSIIGASIGGVILTCIIINVNKKKKNAGKQNQYVQYPKPESSQGFTVSETKESILKPTSEKSEVMKPMGFCPLCGAKRDLDATFCYDCGHKF